MGHSRTQLGQTSELKKVILHFNIRVTVSIVIHALQLGTAFDGDNKTLGFEHIQNADEYLANSVSWSQLVFQVQLKMKFLLLLHYNYPTQHLQWISTKVLTQQLKQPGILTRWENTRWEKFP